MKRSRSIILLLLSASMFIGCSTKKDPVREEYGPFIGTLIVYDKEGFPVSIFAEEKGCSFQGYVKRYENNTERFIIKVNKQICQDGATKDIDGYVADASDGKLDVKSLKIGTKVEVFVRMKKETEEGEMK